MSNLLWAQNLKTPIAIVGLGKSGLSALRFLKTIGYIDSQIITYDEKDLSADCKTHDQLLKKQPQTLVVSPGVPLKSKWIQDLVVSGVEITSELSLACSILTTEKIIGITGSVGKSTVTSILGEGARSIDEHCFIGGNLGTPFCDYAFKVVRGEKKATWVALELSSYQLENCEHLKLHCSAVTYLSANHLERYVNLEEYYNTKMKITEITNQFCVFNKNSIDCLEYSKKSKCPAVLIDANSFENKDILKKILLIGSHNKDNFSVAAEVALLCEWPESSILAMTQFKGLKHRLEFVAEINQVKYINDSKATAMDSVLVASMGCLEEIASESSLYLLLGGKDKNLPWEQLQILKNKAQIKFVFFGGCGQLAKQKISAEGPYFSNLGDAIECCQKNSKNGDIVLLSPGGTSLDEFKNFEERGDFFKRLVLSGAEA